MRVQNNIGSRLLMTFSTIAQNLHVEKNTKSNKERKEKSKQNCRQTQGKRD